MAYLRRAVDREGEILESFVTGTREKAATFACMKQTLTCHGGRDVVTDGLRSYPTAMHDLGDLDPRECCR